MTNSCFDEVQTTKVQLVCLQSGGGGTLMGTMAKNKRKLALPVETHSVEQETAGASAGAQIA